MIPPFLKRQLLAFDGLLTIASMCYIFITGILMVVIIPCIMMLVKWRYDNGYSTMTTELFWDTIPSWTGDLWSVAGTLMALLIIWIGLNFIHYGSSLIYSLWIEEQKINYPLEH